MTNPVTTRKKRTTEPTAAQLQAGRAYHLARALADKHMRDSELWEAASDAYDAMWRACNQDAALLHIVKERTNGGRW